MSKPTTRRSPGAPKRRDAAPRPPTGKVGKAWRKNINTTSPEAIVAELGRRKLTDLETCRRVWEQDGNPLAVAEALRQVEIPEWLADALLVFLSDAARSDGRMQRRLWRSHAKDALDRVRTEATAHARTFDQTWHWAYRLGDALSRNTMTTCRRSGPRRSKRATSASGVDS